MGILTKLAILLILYMAIGATITSVFEDVGTLFICQASTDEEIRKECTDTAWAALGDDVVNLVTGGQKSISEGVKGVVDLKENPPTNGMTQMQIEGLLTSYKNQIYIGLLMTAFMWFVLYLIIMYIAEHTVGFGPPFWMALILMVLAAGLINLVAIGLTESYADIGEVIVNGFYPGFWQLGMHPEIWTYKIANIISPVPTEMFNLTKGDNYTL